MSNVTPADTPTYNFEGEWNPNTVYTGVGGATGTETGPNGQLLPADEVEYEGALWVANFYNEDLNPMDLSTPPGGTGNPGSGQGYAWSMASGSPQVNYNPVVPSAPTDLTAGYKSSTAIALFWSASEVLGEGDVTSYDVYATNDRTGSTSLIGSTTSTTFTATNLSAATNYTFSVDANDGEGVSGAYADPKENYNNTYSWDANPAYTEYGAAAANPTYTTATSGSAAASSGKRFSPYVDVTLPGFNLDSMSEATKVRDFTLAFMTTDTSQYSEGSTTTNGVTTYSEAYNSTSAPGISWGGLSGDTIESTGTIIQQVKDVESEGGRVTISFGGYTGLEPAVAAAEYEANLVKGGDTAAKAYSLALSDLTADYQSVISTYGVNALDFDIEKNQYVDVLGDTAANRLRDAAIKSIEAANSDLQVSFTLATTRTGLNAADLSVLKQAVAAGVTVDTVNIMTMDYGMAQTPAAMLKDAETAAVDVHNQLDNLGLTNTQVGVTPMVGINDVTTETFSLADASALAKWASTQPSWLAGLGEWELGRDNSPGSTQSSGVTETRNYEYTGYLSQVTTAGGGASGQSASTSLIQAAAGFTSGKALATVNAAYVSGMEAHVLSVSHVRTTLA